MKKNSKIVGATILAAATTYALMFIVQNRRNIARQLREAGHTVEKTVRGDLNKF